MSKLKQWLTPLTQKVAPPLMQVRAKALQRWQLLQPREQTMLQLMAVVIAIALLWFAIWQPLQERTQRAEAALESEYNTQSFVENQIAQVLQARNNQQGGSRVNANQLSGVVTTLTNELELEVARMQPQNDSLLLVFNEADFTNLLELLARLSERQVVIEAVDVSETDNAGIVRVRRLLIRV
ncbi:hypothetical protein CWE08_03035 [Aliidiomarina iranensis]|uniref:Type II secretion system protein M n=1 Tax=Aliidiomarina iranensis TaxID=1434071 RepID=A0A432W3C7_9GAMM|nr:type II secretion system protein M [Aliidiomarina iranensis]RUO23636.1 hypothetical protein CWE08_03035 [Aliidiomarina iranensis]